MKLPFEDLPCEKNRRLKIVIKSIIAANFVIHELLHHGYLQVSGPTVLHTPFSIERNTTKFGSRYNKYTRKDDQELLVPSRTYLPVLE